VANNTEANSAAPTEVESSTTRQSKIEFDRVDVITALLTVAVLIAAVAIRSMSDKRVEITLTDAMIAATTAVLVLLVAGRISKFGLSAQGLTVETAKQAILAAAGRPIDQQVKLPLRSVDIAPKLDVGQIPILVARQIEALEFFLGGKPVSYQGNDVQQYLEILTKHTFFQYVIILEPDGHLFGMIDARQLLSRLQQGDGLTFANFAALINNNTSDGRTKLRALRGMVPRTAAVTQQTDKREVLAKMEELRLDWLPVIGADGTCRGVVERSRLTASLILDVTDHLKKNATLITPA
jgi:CBS domain-containing protein